MVMPVLGLGCVKRLGWQSWQVAATSMRPRGWRVVEYSMFPDERRWRFDGPF